MSGITFGLNEELYIEVSYFSVDALSFSTTGSLFPEAFSSAKAFVISPKQFALSFETFAIFPGALVSP